MADHSPDLEPDPDETGTPRWVYAFGIVAVIVVFAFVVSHLMGGAGPGRHSP